MKIEEFLSLLQGVKEGASGWSARCPAHDDREASLSVGVGEDGRILVKCFAGCTAADVVRALGLELKDLYPSGREASGGGQSPSETAPRGGLTLKEFAEAKRLPEEFLAYLGLADCTYNRRPAVRIPYLNTDGEVLAIRFRVAMEGQRFFWRSSDKVALYGLWRLSEIRKAGWVLLVEGESDACTAWHAGLPALGIPGKSAWKEAWRSYMVGLKVYLWEEPEAEDLVRRVFADLPDLLVIHAPQGVKDISEGHLQGKDVAALISSLKAQAEPGARIHQLEEEKHVSELRNAAKAILTADDPLLLVEAAFAKLGYGGDLRHPKIVYLAATSRLLAMRTGSMPVHLLILGVPSAGKSYTLGIVLRLLPKGAYYVIDAGSPRVLIYEDANLQHRVTVFSEADSLPAGEDNPAASAIRNLLQDHRLH